MEEIIPWSYWVEMILPYYFANKCGRKPIGIETMLRMQIWFNLSDEGIEDSIYDSYAMRSFMHIDFNEQQSSIALHLLKFRYMLEANKLGEKIFADVNNRLDKAGLMMYGVSETGNLIREDDEVVYGDSGYLGAISQPAIKNDEKKSKIEFRVNKRPSSLKMEDDFKGLNWNKKYVVCQCKSVNV